MHQYSIVDFAISTTVLKVVLVALVMTGRSRVEGAADVCLNICFCNHASKNVYCSRRGLSVIPQGIPADSLELNLNINPFQTAVIQRSNFSSLTSLERLYMSDCEIEWIQVDTFKDMIRLKFLDLSSNKISWIQDSTFRGLALHHLFLNGNLNIRLTSGSFEGLSTTGLYLHDCSLAHFSADILAPLNSTLRNLWLKGNALEKLSKSLLPAFASLSHISLGSNPLHCNCETAWLKDFYDSNNELFNGDVLPSCSSPLRMKGKFFNNLSSQDFRCQAPVFNNIDTHFDTSRGRLRCTASGDPAPTLFWIRPSGEAKKYAVPANQDTKFNEGILAISNMHQDEMSGMYICIAANDAGNVTLTVNVSWPRPTSSSSSGSSGMSYKVLTNTPEHVHPVVRTLLPPPGNSASSPSSNRVRHVDDVNNKVGGVSADGDGDTEDDEEIDISNDDNDEDIDTPASEDSFDMLQRDKETTSGDDETRETLFSLGELIGAIVGTHVCTLLLCLVLVSLYFRRRWRPPRLNYTPEKVKYSSDPFYRNGGLGPKLDYLNTTPTSSIR